MNVLVPRRQIVHYANGRAVAQPFNGGEPVAGISLSGTTFEVIEDRGEGAQRPLWCAAGRICRRPAGWQRTADQIYLKSAAWFPRPAGLPRRCRLYTDDAEFYPRPRIPNLNSVSVRTRGQNPAVCHANPSFCQGLHLELNRLLINGRHDETFKTALCWPLWPQGPCPCAGLCAK